MVIRFELGMLTHILMLHLLTMFNCLKRFLIVEALVSAFLKKKALLRAFSGHCENIAKVS